MADRKSGGSSTAVDTKFESADLPVPVVTASVGALADDEGLGLPLKYLQRLNALRGQTVLVTGGCGFVGRHIVYQLLCAGSKVRVFEMKQTLDNPRSVRYASVEYCAGDVTSKSDFMKALLPPGGLRDGVGTAAGDAALNQSSSDVFAVIHVASPPPTLKNPELFHRVNVGGTTNVLDCCIALGCGRVVYTSSASVVADGTDQKSWDETHAIPLKSLDGYTISKLRGEQTVLRYGNEKKLATCALRPHVIYGPRDPHFWTALADVGRKGKSKFMIGDGTTLSDATYVENVAYSHVLAASELAVDARINGNAYFITNREPILFWDFASWVHAGYGWTKPWIILPYTMMWVLAWVCGTLKLPTSFDLQRVSYAGTYHYYSCEKAVRDFAYEPPYTVAHGVAKTLTYLRKFSPQFFNEKAPSAADAAAAADRVTVTQSTGVVGLIKGWGGFVLMIALVIAVCTYAGCQVKGAFAGEAKSTLQLVWAVVYSLVWVYIAWCVINLTPFVPFGLHTITFDAKRGAPRDMNGKNVVITGGNKGIGFETAVGLAKLGASVSIACRDAGRATEAVAAIKKAVAAATGRSADSIPIEALSLDLSSFASVNKLVEVLSRRAAADPQNRSIDVLIANAGGMCDRGTTADGHDQTFQSNYLSHFLLIDRLLKAGAFTADARIVSVSSLTHWQVALSTPHIQSDALNTSGDAASFNSFWSYCRTKLAQILHVRQLNAVLRAQRSNISVNAVHPGCSYTDFVNHFRIPGAKYFCTLFTQSPKQCAQTVMYAAASTELLNVSGQYISNCAIGMSSAHSKDMRLAKQLYDRSQQLIAKA